MGTSILDDLARHGDDFRMIKINLLNHHTGAGPCFFRINLECPFTTPKHHDLLCDQCFTVSLHMIEVFCSA